MFSNSKYLVEFKSMLCLLMIGFMLSCTNDESTIPDSADLDLKVTLNFEGFMENGVKLSSSDDPETLNKSIRFMIKELENYEKDNLIHYVLEEKEGDIYLTGYGIYNNEGTLLKSEHIYENRNNERSIPPYIPPNLVAGPCPEGYTSLGSCSNFGDTESCLGDLATDYFSNNLNSPGDCAQVRLTVGALNTQACGQNC